MKAELEQYNFSRTAHFMQEIESGGMCQPVWKGLTRGNLFKFYLNVYLKEVYRI